MDKFVALIGDMLEGFVAVGPFDTARAADEHTREDRTETKVRIAVLETPRATLEDEPEWTAPHVVLAGDPFAGFRAIGPFGDDDHASWYGDNHTPGDYETLPLVHQPADPLVGPLDAIYANNAKALGLGEPPCPTD